MHDIIETTNNVSKQTDHWLFLCVLMIMGIGVLFSFRWLVTKYEKLTEQSRTDQQQYVLSLLNVVSEGNKTQQSLAVVLDRCSSSLEDNTNELRMRREKS